jgi:hypothetical protein
MTFAELYRSRALYSCFDGDGAGTSDGSAAGDGASVGGGVGSGDNNNQNRTFTQDDVNRLLAEDRRKHQAQLKTMETKLQEVLASRNLTETERKALQENLAAVQGQLRTKDQQAALEKKEMEEQFSAKLTEAEKKVQTWESLYRETTIDRSLQDAAVKNDAFSPSQIVTFLRPMTKLLEEMDQVTKKTTGRYKPVVEMPDVDPKTGEPVMMVRTPEEAVKRMKELPDQYGNLFKAGVVSGIGSGSATGGLLSGHSGRVDVRKLTPAQFREIYEKNPELLGLRPNKSRR